MIFVYLVVNLSHSKGYHYKGILSELAVLSKVNHLIREGPSIFTYFYLKYAGQL